MKVLNFGSLNIDHVYHVDHFVRPGETVASSQYQRFCGGKGLNQSVALANAGAETWHAGLIGVDGEFLRLRLQTAGVKTDFVHVCSTQSGQAIIQIDRQSENAIVLDGGANQQITQELIHSVVAAFSPNDLLLVQNEVNNLPEIMRSAHSQGMHIAFNPAPMRPEVQDYPLELVNIFIVNEIEAAELAGSSATDPQKNLQMLIARFPQAIIVQTMGSKGVLCGTGNEVIYRPAITVKAVDTTAAGDTFIGFFLAQLYLKSSITAALDFGCRAAAITVTRHGAANSIPNLSEIETPP